MSKTSGDDDIPFAEPVSDDDIPFAEPVDDDPDDEAPTPGRPNIQVHEFDGSSTDVEWTTFNFDTGEVLIQFLEHGDRTGHAHLYSYEDITYAEWHRMINGFGPFPSGRDPYYTKPISVGQNVNYHIRHDHMDDLHEYRRES